MSHNTTCNIHQKYFSRINDAVILTGLTKSRLIVFLLQKVSGFTIVSDYEEHIVKYQGRARKKFWKIVHVSFSRIEYESAIDLRKIHKKSLSRILAEAVELYLDELIGELLSKPESIDNYRLENYICRYSEKNNVKSWIFNWKKPQKRKKPKK